MAYVSEKALSHLLSIPSSKVRQLALEGIFEAAEQRPDGSFKYDTSQPLLAAFLDMTPIERREAGVPDSRGLNAAELKARQGRSQG